MKNFKEIKYLMLILASIIVFNSNYLKAEEGLKLQISSKKSIYHLEEPILIEAKVINLSENIISIIMPPSGINISYPGESSQNDFKVIHREEIRDEAGRLIHEIEIVDLNISLIGGSLGYAEPENYIYLKKNEFYGSIQEYSLSEMLSTPGKHMITMVFYLKNFKEPLRSNILEIEIINEKKKSNK